jgi:hypothetical protein
MVYLAKKRPELSLVPPRGRCPSGINWAYLFTFTVLSNIDNLQNTFRIGNSHHLAQNSAGPLCNVEDELEDMITWTLPYERYGNY